MACTKSQLISAINSFASARVSGDGNLVAFSANLVGQLIDTLEFSPEEDLDESEEANEEATEEESDLDE